jgi:hypothetical protein
MRLAGPVPAFRRRLRRGFDAAAQVVREHRVQRDRPCRDREALAAHAPLLHEAANVAVEKPLKASRAGW